MNEALPFDVRRISGALGAEVHGIDLRHDQPAGVVAALRRAWLEHGVLFFRDQPLSPAQYLRLAGWFGQPVEYPFIKGIDGFPVITPVVKLEHERNNFGGIWHSDTTYLEQPPMASMLIAREVPPFGGDTLFACQYRALDALSPALQATLATLAGVSSSSKADVSRTREDRIRDGGRDDARREYVAEHPVVRTHPETGRRALYVNVAHTARFAGWTEAESAPLHRTDEAMWQRMIAVNLTGTYHCIHSVLPSMLAAGFGRIINIASSAGQVGYPYVAAYCAAKHGVIGLTRALALETAARGITVNAVCPGYTDTAIVRDAVRNIRAKTGRSEEDALASLVRSNPQGRLVQPAEVANAVTWLCLPGSESVTGQSIAVSGGEVT